MFQFLFSNDPNKYWMRLLIFCIIILGFFMLIKKLDITPFHEGFTQTENFVLKMDNEIYDDFYTQIYDRLFNTEKITDYEIQQIVKITSPTAQSVFLDIGSGTGYLVNKIKDMGFHAYGVDKSPAMIKYSESKYPDNDIILADVNVPMTFDKNTFTHITCMNYTIYHFKDKFMFFKNCFDWLNHNGFLFIHLVDRQKFSPIIPAGKPAVLDNPQKYSKFRIKDTLIDFIDFTYKASYSFDHANDKNEVGLKETFTDKLTNNVRQNECTMQMENIEVILAIARKCGFIVHGQFNLEVPTGDDKQYVFILERPM